MRRRPVFADSIEFDSSYKFRRRKLQNPMAEAQSETKFLDALATAQQTAGVYLFKQFISTAEAAEVFVKLNDDNNVPWDHNRVLGGERLNSHACDFKRSEKEIRKWTGATSGTCTLQG